jgi:hypothetical protein
MAALGSISASIWQHAAVVFIFLLPVTEGFYTASSRTPDNVLSDPIYRYYILVIT